MARPKPVPHKGAEEARNRLPELLDAAEKGRTTVITRHGRAVAALVPIGTYESRHKQQSLLSLVGSGRGLWGSDSAITVAALREEWSR
jgi:prevent-host-death family protein